MKLIQLHKVNTVIAYKNSVCSIATFVTAILSISSIILPILLMYILNPYSAIPETVTFYEKPSHNYQFHSVLMGETKLSHARSQLANTNTIICTHFIEMHKTSNIHKPNDKCGSLKYWSENNNNNGIMDKIHFSQDLSDLSDNLSSIDWMLLMQFKIMRKCAITLPAILTLTVDIPHMRSGQIIINGELQLKQYMNFMCPTLLQRGQTQIYLPELFSNFTYFSKDKHLFALLQKQLKLNPIYFYVKGIYETLFEPKPYESGLTIQLDLDVINLPVRYKLNVWERLGPIWLYIASFFSISFYITNKIKDYLFSKYIVYSCQVVPWKKHN